MSMKAMEHNMRQSMEHNLDVIMARLNEIPTSPSPTRKSRDKAKHRGKSVRRPRKEGNGRSSGRDSPHPKLKREYSTDVEDDGFFSDSCEVGV